MPGGKEWHNTDGKTFKIFNLKKYITRCMYSGSRTTISKFIYCWRRWGLAETAAVWEVRAKKRSTGHSTLHNSSNKTIWGIQNPYLCSTFEYRLMKYTKFWSTLDDFKQNWLWVILPICYVRHFLWSVWKNILFYPRTLDVRLLPDC